MRHSKSTRVKEYAQPYAFILVNSQQDVQLLHTLVFLTLKPAKMGKEDIHDRNISNI